MPSMTKEDFHQLEESERRAVLAGDVAAIESFWSPELLVNAPHNSLLVGVDATLDMVRKGVIDFERFDRIVERVEIDADIAVSMGSEAIMQKHVHKRASLSIDDTRTCGGIQMGNGAYATGTPTLCRNRARFWTNLFVPTVAYCCNKRVTQFVTAWSRGGGL